MVVAGITTITQFRNLGKSYEFGLIVFETSFKDALFVECRRKLTHYPIGIMP